MTVETHNKSVLYVSYDGMTDSLGQSQVIPYLTVLSKNGYDIHILSAEKPEAYAKRKDFIGKLLSDNNIQWHPVPYTKKPPIVSTVKDVFRMKKEAHRLHKQYNFSIIHCRSYISAFVGVYMKRKFGTKFIFDMRGFYADERVDGKLWNRSNPVYNAVYKYFKRKERLFFTQADHTISLTYAGRDIIHTFAGLENIPIEVIPCCADTELFDFHKIDTAKVEQQRKDLGIAENEFVVTYLGSIGTWYMAEEMMHFFKLLKASKPNAKFLFISRDNPQIIHSLCDKYGINHSDAIVHPADRENVPTMIAVGNVSLFFIKPVFSKKASSPTKLAELLGMGMPVICNGDVGDLDKFMQDTPFGLITTKFDDETLNGLVSQVDTLQNLDREYLRKISLDLFSLKIGAERYLKVYRGLEG